MTEAAATNKTAPKREPLPRVPTGIPGLDAILDGGFVRGGIAIIQGQPGAGKTILGNQICYNHIAAGGRALYITLLAESHSRMLGHIGQLGFFNEAAIPDHIYYMSAFKVLEDDGLKGLLSVIRREVQRREAGVVILDGLVAVEETADSPREFKKFIHELQTQATLADCTMFLLTSASAGNIPLAAEHTMVDGVVEMRSELYGRKAERHLQVHKRRGGGFVRGQHAYRIDDTGIVVYPRTEALLKRPSAVQNLDSADRLPTSIVGVDGMIGGGIVRGSSTAIIGPTGIGKTIFGLHFLSGCGPSEPGLMFGMHEPAEALYAQARNLGLPVADHIDRGVVDIMWRPTTEGVLDQICTELLDAVRRRGARRVFIDGIDGFTQIASDNSRVSHVVTALSNELRALGVTTLWSAQVDVGYQDVASPLSGLALQGLSPIVENIIVMRHVELRAKLFRMINVLKARLSSIERSFRCFEVGGSGIVVDPDSTCAEDVLAELLERPFMRGGVPGSGATGGT
ncbi:ATPase domain-containing protein [Novosphingobium sp. 9U]|uniref:RAD55 family ATPase n=1 Tax=Novosphingobium sp. 9U TaxID=2653158 RepID=UPI0012F29068|nr:ATPase domain-containing protein [Novosphingobium sp. 9U]VWX48321.1 Serine/threonine protein phosphatase [Novosphingobium sp. 9U]